MGQVLLGLFAVVSVVAAFWAVGRMAPRRAIFPEEVVRAQLALMAKEPLRPSTYILSTVAGSVATAMALGIALPLHRWPDALVYAFFLTLLIALLVIQLRAIEDRSHEVLRRLGHQGLRGVAGASFGLVLMGPSPTSVHDLTRLGLPLIWAMVLAANVWRESRRGLSIAGARL
jgi:hypothetical protein